MAECKYRTEREARLDYVLECTRWAGAKEGSIPTEYITIYTMVVGFHFGTQTKKEG